MSEGALADVFFRSTNRSDADQAEQNRYCYRSGRQTDQIAIIEETGVQIDINDDGLVSISSTNVDAMEKAKKIVHGLTAEVEIGKIYKGPITSIMPFGFFVEIMPGKEGLLHISEISHQRIQDIRDTAFRVGDEIEVKVLDVNDRGQIKLSHKALLEKSAQR